MQQTDGPSSSVSFPTQDSPATRAASPASDPRGSPTAPPKLGSRSTSFAIMESPHRSAVPSPLGPGSVSSQRRRVVTQTPTISRKGKERELGNQAGELFAGYGVAGVGDDLLLGPDDSDVVEDVQRLLNRRDSRQRTKEPLTSSPTAAPDTAATSSPIALRQARPTITTTTTPTKSQTAPAQVNRSAPTTPSKPRQAQTSLSSQAPSTSTEALVIYDNPTASSSKTTLDWSGYIPHEQQPARHKRKFSLTRMRKTSRTEMQTSDTGEDADTFEASLKAIRDRTSENTWSRVAGAKQELSSRYSTFFRFLNEFHRAFNPADVLRWKARHGVASSNMSGLIPTTSLPSFTLSASDPNLRLFLDDGRNMRFKLTSSTIHEWLEAEVKPPSASDMLSSAPSSPKLNSRNPPKPRSRGASLSVQHGATDVPGSPAESSKRSTRLSHPGPSLDSLKGPLNAMLTAARKEREGAEHGASLAKLSAKAMRAFRRDHSPLRSHPTSAANSEDESGASQRNKVSISVSRPQTPEVRSLVGGVDSITDDDGRSGRSLGHLAKKSWHNLLSMTSMGDRDRLSDLSPMQLSPVLSPAGSTDAVNKTLDSTRNPRGPYLEPNWNTKRAAAVTSKSSEEFGSSPHVRKMYQQRARELDELRRENETTKRFLRSVADTLREYARLQKDFADLLGTDGSAIDEQVLAAIDLDPFYIPRAQRKTPSGTSWRAAEDVGARIQAQNKALDNCLSHCDRGLLKPPGPELGDNLSELLTALHALEAEREEISRTADELAELEPIVERLNAEFEWEVSDVERVISQSYGIKTSATVMTSQWESSMARFMEFCLTRGATAYRYTTTRKRIWLTIVLLSLVYIVIDSGWGRWVVLYIYTALITTGLGLAFAFAIVVIVTFVAKGGYSNASSFAS